MVDPAPPPGFEDTAGPQTAVVDLYFLGTRIGEAVTTFEPGRLRFRDPGAVAAAMPRIADPAAVAAALSGPLDSHPDLVCGPRPHPRCGMLEPAVAAVIFDDERFRADLFVAQRLLRGGGRGEHGPRLLPPAVSGPSLVWDLFGAVAGAEDRTSHTIGLSPTASLGAARTSARLLHSDEQGPALDAAALDWDMPGSRWTGGLFSMGGLSLTAERMILGTGLASSIDTRMDAAISQGSELLVFLARPATVEVLRDGRLLSARTYQAGAQAIDTAPLPLGAYEVTLRIREVGGGLREETRFFVKFLDVPAADEPRYTIQAGWLTRNAGRGLPQGTGEPVLRAGAGWRLSEPLAVGADLVAATGTRAVEVSAMLFRPWGAWRLSALADDGGGRGLGLSGGATKGRVSYGVSARRIWAGPDPEPAGAARFDPTARSIEQAGLSLGYGFAATSLSLRATWRRADGVADWAAGPSLVWRLGGGASPVELAADAALGRDEQVARVVLRMRHYGARWGGSAETGLQHARGTAASGVSGSAQLDWHDDEWLRDDLSAAMRAAHGPGLSTAGIGGTYRGDAVSAELDVDRFRASGTATTRWSGSFSTHGAGTTLTGLAGGQSAIIVSLEGARSEDMFEVVVDDAPRGSLRPGGTLAVFLPSYRLYSVRLRSAGGSVLEFDPTPRPVPLYPGNVARLTWRLERLFVAHGRLLAADGTPLRDARIEGGRGYAETDGEGYFQVELTGGRRLRSTGADGPCGFDVEVPPAAELLVRLGAVACRPDRPQGAAQ